MAAEQKTATGPPVAEKRPHTLEHHGHVRVDDYFWLNDRTNPDMIAYLEAENAYTEAAMAHTEALRERLFEEIKGRIQQTDESVPYGRKDHYYYTRFEDGKQYPIFCRKQGRLDAPEQVMIDANVLAKGESFLNVGSLAISYGQNLLAYSIDTVGRRKYAIHFKDIETGEVLEDTIPNVTPNMAWANDNRTLFYTKQHPETLRAYRVYRHTLGTDAADDVLVYEETDETFRCGVSKSRSEKYMLLGSFQTLSHEYRYLEADRPEGAWTVFLPREREHEYDIDHLHDTFYIRTNDTAQNFKLMKTAEDRTAKEYWEEVLPHRDDTYLGRLELFNDFFVVEERRDALVHLRIIPWEGEGHYLEFEEPAYDANIGANPEPDTNLLRYNYTSMTTPTSVFDYDVTKRESNLLKEEPVLGGFDKANYRTERLRVTARDGAKVPVSLVYRRDLRKPGGNPLLLYGYGSYGASSDPAFSSPRISLLDRGFIFAIAHIRGGQELGRQWYENGKLLKKKNTFTDFIDVGKFLVEERYADPAQLYATGGSAGGLLVGAVINMAPELFHGVMTRVPFVDVVTTMLDSDIPLTTSEYDEWGDPNEKEYYDYILSYSPYDQVQAKRYPHLFVTTGLHDSQVQYWEPAKWVAKLRAFNTGDSRILLKTNMDAGHGGASGRYERYRETAENYAFLLDLAGIPE